MKKVTKPSVSYGNSYLDKKKTAPKKEESKIDNDSNGVVKKFLSLDDIPDVDSKPAPARSVPSSNTNVYSSRESYSTNNNDDQFSQQYPTYRPLQPSIGNGIAISTGNKGGFGVRALEDDTAYHAKASPKFGPPLQLSPKYRPSSGSFNSARSNNGNSNAGGVAPPLPYELKQMSEVPKLRSPQPNPAFNANKYDYDDPDDDDDWNEPTPPQSPHKPVVYNAKVNSIVPVKPSNGSRAAAAVGGSAGPPPLPHEVNSSSGAANNNNGKGMTEEEKLYFSRQPRQVANFKPYSLKEYNITKPKGYVMIESLKPDLNTEELIAKRNNAERIKQFSKNLSNYNKEMLTQQRKLPSSNEKHDIEISKMKYESKNHRAKEFSKNIPKPVVQQQKRSHQLQHQHQYQEDGEEGFQEYDGESDWKEQRESSHRGAGAAGAFYSQDDLSEMKLQQLTAKHNQSRQQVESIRRAMGL